MGRKKRIPDDAEGVSAYLTPEQHLALQVIRSRRKQSGNPKSSISEVIVDALWKLLADEGIPKEQISALLAVNSSGDTAKTNLRKFPKADQG